MHLKRPKDQCRPYENGTILSNGLSRWTRQLLCKVLTQKLLQLVKFRSPKDSVDLMRMAQFWAMGCLDGLGNYSARFWQKKFYNWCSLGALKTSVDLILMAQFWAMGCLDGLGNWSARFWQKYFYNWCTLGVPKTMSTLWNSFTRGCQDGRQILCKVLTEKLLQLVQFMSLKDSVDLMRMAQFWAMGCLDGLGNYSARFWHKNFYNWWSLRAPKTVSTLWEWHNSEQWVV